MINSPPLAAAIDPRIFAGKLARAARRELPALAVDLERNPRIVEALWYIQARSRQPGGLDALAKEIIDGAGDLIATGSPGGRGCNVEILRRLPDEVLGEPRLLGDLLCWFRAEHPTPTPAADPADEIEVLTEPGFRASCGPTARERQGWFAQVRGRLGALAPSVVQDVVRDRARDMLAQLLLRWCVDDSQRWAVSTWSMDNPMAALLQRIDADYRAQIETIANTEVKRRILGELDYAYSEGRPVHINGFWRTGKTTAIRTCAAAAPGRWRYVAVPSYLESNGEFLRQIAESLGVPVAINTTAPQISADLAFVLNYAPIGLALDEAHFLWPCRGSRGTPPDRVNWVRTQVVDRGLPCVICTDPRDNAAAAKAYERRSKHPIGQWLGRWVRTVDLPEDCGQEDMVAVARRHLPGVSDALLLDVASRAALHAGYLAAIDEVAARARYLARKAGRIGFVAAADVKAALDDTLPAAGSALFEAAAAPAQTARKPAAGGRQTVRTGSGQRQRTPGADRTTEATIDGFPGRRIAPADDTPSTPELGADRRGRIRAASVQPA